MPTSVLRSVALGLSLATASLAHAGATAEQVAAQRALLQKHVDVTSFVRGGIVRTPSWGSLQQHHAALGSHDGYMHLAGTSSDAIVANDAGALFTKKGSTIAPAQVADLVRHGIASKETLDLAVEKHLISATGTPEHATHAETVTAATQAATAQVGQVTLAARTLTQLHQTSATLNHAGLIQRHYNATFEGQRVSGAHYELLSHKDGSKLLVGPGQAAYFVPAGGPFRAASTRDLAHMSIRSPADVTTALAHRVVELAGTGGSPTNPTDLAHAESVLAQKTQDVTTLKQVLVNPKALPDLALVLQAHADVAARDGHAAKSVTLATKGDEHLVAPSRGLDAQGRVTAAALVVTKGDTSRPATFADYEHFGLGTVARLNEAVGEAMFEISREDLDIVQ